MPTASLQGQARDCLLRKLRCNFSLHILHCHSTPALSPRFPLFSSFQHPANGKNIGLAVGRHNSRPLALMPRAVVFITIPTIAFLIIAGIWTPKIRGIQNHARISMPFISNRYGVIHLVFVCLPPAHFYSPFVVSGLLILHYYRLSVIHCHATEFQDSTKG